MKNVILILFGLSLLFLIACENVDTNEVNGDGLGCNEPYIMVGSDCCLDKNDNKLCDEPIPTRTILTTTTTTTTTTTMSEEFLSLYWGSSLAITSYSISNNQLFMELKNNFGNIVIINNIYIENKPIYSQPLNLESGETENLVYDVDNICDDGNNFAIEVEIIYTNVETGRKFTIPFVERNKLGGVCEMNNTFPNVRPTKVLYSYWRSPDSDIRIVAEVFVNEGDKDFFVMTLKNNLEDIITITDVQFDGVSVHSSSGQPIRPEGVETVGNKDIGDFCNNTGDLFAINLSIIYENEEGQEFIFTGAGNKFKSRCSS